MSNAASILISLVAATFGAPLLAAFFASSLTSSTNSGKHQRLISDLNCMAAGIFTGITFFHIIAESFEKIVQGSLFAGKAAGEVLRVQSALFLLGFVLMVWLDKMVFLRFHEAHTHTHIQRDAASATAANSPRSPREQLQSMQSSLTDGGGDLRHARTGLPGIDHVPSGTGVANGRLPLRKSEDHDNTFLSGDGTIKLDMDDYEVPLVSRPGLHSEEFHPHDTHEADAHSNSQHLRGRFPMERKRNRLMANGLLVAFCVHSFIEGLAFGSETPDMEVLGIFIIFAAHKGLDGLAVALPLSKVYSPRPYWTLVTLFSTATPLGLVVSYALLQDGGPMDVFAGIVEATSGGVFMYIALFHIFAEELEDTKDMRRKVIIFTLAIIFMSFVEFVG